MTEVRGGRTHYGQAIGILTLETKFPRVPGDAGNATSYSFPVKLVAVKGATQKRTIQDADPTLLQPFVEAVKELERGGVRAITTSCGFLAMFQDEMAEAVSVPVFTSALMMVPLVHKMLGRNNRVGIITADLSSLTEKHLKGAGIGSIPLAIAGLEDQPEFSRLLRNEDTLDTDKVEKELIKVSRKLIAENPDIGALVLECSNLPPYSRALSDAVGLPVFDLVDFVNFVYSAVAGKKRFTDGFL